MAFGLEKLTSVLKQATEKNDQIIGIDMGSSAIKVVQLKNDDGVPTLVTYGELQLGPYGNLEVGEVTQLETAKLTEALVDIIREASVTANSVAMAVPYISSFATTIDVASLDEIEISKRIPVEARKYVPVPLSEVTFDWFPLSKNTEAGSTKLLLVAIYNDALNRLKSVLFGAGLTVTYTELEPFSAVRSSITKDDVDVALIDFGAMSTKLYIAHDGVLQKIHNLRPTGYEMTTMLQKTHNLTFAAAEEFKRSNGLADNEAFGAGVQEMRNMIGRCLHEMDKVIDAHEEETGVTIGRVIALGGGAFLPGLFPYAQDILQRNITVADPFSKVAFPAFLEDTLKETGTSFSVAVGAALRAFG
jgi:type IV pilus assembly protein PilM